MLRVRSRNVGGWFLAVGVVGTAVVGACADPKGAIMLAVNTDMRAPKDVNAVSVTISTNGAIKHSFIGRVTPQGEVLLPATLAIVEPEDKSASIRIRVMAFQDQKARVLRDVRTTVPQGGRTALLRIPLNFVNADASVVGPGLPPGIVPDPVPGTAAPPVDGGSGGGAPGGSPGASAGDFDFFSAFQPACPDIEKQTFIDGECKDNYIDPETLPDFDSAALGDSTDQGSCFDLARCFAGALGVGEQGADDTLDNNTCALQLNGANVARLNLAIVTEDTGECVRPGECYVPIDRGAGGWREEGGRIQLPTFVCKLLASKNLRLATSTEVCDAKEESNPICTPKVGDPIPMDSGTDSAPVRLVPEDFATATVLAGPTLYFASSSRVGTLNLTEPNAVGVQIQGIAVDGSARLPWRFSDPLAGPLALANGTAEGFSIMVGQGQATKITIAPGAIDVTGFRGSTGMLAWAVQGTGGATASIYTGGIQGSAVKQSLAVGPISAIASTGDDNGVILGGTDGTLRACVLPEQCSAPVTIPGGGRIDAVSVSPNGGRYVLSASGIARALVIASGSGVGPLIPFVEGDFSGVVNGSLYFARGIANNGRCVFFSNKAGLSYAFDSGDGKVAQTKLLVPAPETAPILGITVGPAQGARGPGVYFTKFSVRALDGGLWSVPVPNECLLKVPSGPDAGDFDAGVEPEASVPCNQKTCDGCCSGNACRRYTAGEQSEKECGNGGNLCIPCGGDGGPPICNPGPGMGGSCAGGG